MTTKEDSSKQTDAEPEEESEFDLEQAQKNIDYLFEQLKQAISRALPGRERIKELEQEIEDLRGDLKDLEKENEELQNRINELEEQIAEPDILAAHIETKIRDLTFEIETGQLPLSG